MQDPTRDILDCLSNLSSDEVFTAPHLADKMLDVLPDSLWCNPNARFLDPAAKSGVFLRQIKRRLMQGLSETIPDPWQRLEHILRHQVFGIALTDLTALVARRTLYCHKDARHLHPHLFETAAGKVYFARTKHEMHKGKCIHCGAPAQYDTRPENHAYAFIHPHTSDMHKEIGMQFDVIIGNPPYQLSDGGAQASAKPIYQHFVRAAKAMKPKHIVMITPSRWFTGGKGLDDFRDEMLSDTHMAALHDFPDSRECFPNNEIKGGVSYFHWCADHAGPCRITTHTGAETDTATRYLKEPGLSVFIRHNRAMSILRKVRAESQASFMEVVSSSKPFGLRTYVKGTARPKSDQDVTLYQNGGIGYIARAAIPSGGGSWINIRF